MNILNSDEGFYVVGSREKKTIRTFTDRIAAKPVKAWFDGSTTKPTILVSSQPYETLYGAAKDAIEQNKWDDVLISSFMMRYIETNEEAFKQSSPINWSSYGHTIAEAASRVSPLNLVHCDRKETAFAAAKISDPEETKAKLFWPLVFLYRDARLAGSPYTNYSDAIKTKLQDIMMGEPFKLDPLQAWSKVRRIGRVALTPNYRKVIAMLDMFFYQFPDHKYVSCRTSTMQTRADGCTTLSSLGHIAKILGIAPTFVNFFIFPRTAYSEFVNMCDVPSENKPESYDLYQINLIQNGTSPYSQSNNPSLYLWLHVLGCVKQDARSVKAVMPKASGIDAIMECAAYVGLHLGGVSIGLHGAADEATSIKAAGMGNNSVEKASGKELYTEAARLEEAFRAQDYRLSASERAQVIAKTKYWREVRAESVGHHVRAYFTDA